MTYVNTHAGPHDVVIDYETIGAAMHGASHTDVMSARNALLRRVTRGEMDAGRVWITSSNPDAAAMFPHHELVTLGDPAPGPTRREW
jgi:hypothetical protein